MPKMMKGDKVSQDFSTLSTHRCGELFRDSSKAAKYSSRIGPFFAHVHYSTICLSQINSGELFHSFDGSARDVQSSRQWHYHLRGLLLAP
jgi:hypothetical protein